MHCHGSMRVHAALSAAQAGPIGRCLLCCCCCCCRHGSLRALRHPLLLPSHLRPWRNQCQGRAEGPAGQLWLARIVVVLVPDAPARRGTRVNEKPHHHQHHGRGAWDIVITGHQDGTDGAGATQTHAERVRGVRTIPTASSAAPPFIDL